ncbi:MAG: F0F1 ATP synthase subunit gamma [Acidimicrobiia bacterium]|nr:F0F1 ATP synthase subunit gamma [Acidimicrobiia bacterium]
MPTIEGLSRKLRVGEELHTVVGTMKGLAAVAIHDFEHAVRALSEYTATVEQGLQILLSLRSEPILPTPVDTGRTALIVIGTDQGLCGPINREIVAAAVEWCAAHDLEPERRVIVALGLRAARELEAAGFEPDQTLELPGSVEAISRVVDDLVVRIDSWRSDLEVSRVIVAFQHPIQRTQRTTRMFQVVPPDVRRLRAIAGRRWPTRMLPGTPHAPEQLTAGLLRQDLFIALFRAIAEAKTAEHGARLSAMQAAEQNIDERLTTLRTEYHQLRQALITEELLDVVSGFEALDNSY